MFSLFKSPSFHDPELGELRRSRRRWRGSLAVEASGDVPLVLAGTRSAPDPQAVAIAREVPTQLARWRPAIESALFEHYSPYAEALAAGDFPAGSPNPGIASPDQVWPHVSLVFVSVTPQEGGLTTELGYATSWDEEHTLGARFQSDQLVELCGSVLPP